MFFLGFCSLIFRLILPECWFSSEYERAWGHILWSIFITSLVVYETVFREEWTALFRADGVLVTCRRCLSHTDGLLETAAVSWSLLYLMLFKCRMFSRKATEESLNEICVNVISGNVESTWEQTLPNAEALIHLRDRIRAGLSLWISHSNGPLHASAHHSPAVCLCFYIIILARTFFFLFDRNDQIRDGLV